MNKLERIKIVTRIGDLIEDHCSECERKNGTRVFDCNTLCEVGKQLRSLGKQLEQEEENMPKEDLTVEKYVELKKSGLTDAEIRSQLKIGANTLIEFKKQHGLNSKQKGRPNNDLVLLEIESLKQQVADEHRQAMKYEQEYSVIKRHYNKLEKLLEEQKKQNEIVIKNYEELKQTADEMSEENDSLRQQKNYLASEVKHLRNKLEEQEERFAKEAQKWVEKNFSLNKELQHEREKSNYYGKALIQALGGKVV